eukprot:CAMPEP_0184319502 /NCGR_PEP_ID=MMETSP1049-20130417/108828_1 /TAXON_ID=77928 /ORGANISM="Proteomonas sulcata, Strain CCMP704" /LENGTH=108 /DNA_ID=CAMNT_0026639647 /DNA_START=825 /DNA_END=1151 /DNA_ORIENTATION=+
MKVNLEYFDDLWVCLDLDNSGEVDYREFFDNMMKSQHETLRDPKQELAGYLTEEELLNVTEDLVASPWQQKEKEPLQRGNIHLNINVQEDDRFRGDGAGFRPEGYFRG